MSEKFTPQRIEQGDTTSHIRESEMSDGAAIKHLEKGAQYIIEMGSNDEFVNEVKTLHATYGGMIPDSDVEELADRHSYEPNMVRAMANVLDGREAKESTQH